MTQKSVVSKDALISLYDDVELIKETISKVEGNS
jgi:hypothetical protein